MFLAALAEVHTGLVPHDGDGFVIITATSDQGMVNIHDRRPLALAPQHARKWLDMTLERERAEELALECCQPTEEFEWYTVDKAVGSVKNQGPELFSPLIP